VSDAGRRGRYRDPVLVWVPVGVVVVGLLGALGSYNHFVRQRSLIDNSWSNVDTELKRRYDLIPNLVETVKGYATHERTTLEAVAAARSRAMADAGSPEEQAASENVLVGSLRSLLAVSEAYPDLQASTGFTDLQRQLTATEDRIQAARRFYNGNVRDFNQRVQSVPSNLVATLGRFTVRQYFQIDEAVERDVPEVSLGTGAVGPTETAVEPPAEPPAPTTADAQPDGPGRAEPVDPV
jgi:LemA protein